MSSKNSPETKTPPHKSAKILLKDRGAFGSVKVQQNAEGVLIATKTFFEPSENQDEIAFVREYLTQEYSHLIHVLNVLPDDCGYQMEACMGGNLVRFIQKTHSDSSIFPTSLLLQIARGVHIMHVELDAAHRDLKPNNIVLHAYPNNIYVAKIADFGLVKTNVSQFKPDNKQPLSMPVVTRPYRAPEVLLLMNAYNPFAVDIWSLGVVFLDCFNQYLLLNASSRYGTLIKIIQHITGKLTSENFPTLLQQAASGLCRFEHASDRPKVSGIIKKITHGNLLHILDEDGTMHKYKQLVCTRLSVGEKYVFQQQYITPKNLEETFQNFPDIPQPKLCLKYCDPKLYSLLVPIIRGMLEPDEKKRWNISNIVHALEKIIPS